MNNTNSGAIRTEAASEPSGAIPLQVVLTGKLRKVDQALARDNDIYRRLCSLMGNILSLSPTFPRAVRSACFNIKMTQKFHHPHTWLR
jgi:hypothetical protein